MDINKYILFVIIGVIAVGCNNKESEKPSKDIWESTYMADIKAVTYYLDQGTDVDIRDENGWTPLHYAAITGNIEFVKLFVENGADVNIKNNEGLTPLDIATKHEHQDTIDFLRKHCKSIEEAGRKGS